MSPAPDGAREALGEMRAELLGDSRRRDIERARLSAEELREVKNLAWLLRRGGRDAGAVYRRQAYGDLAQRVAGIGR